MVPPKPFSAWCLGSHAMHNIGPRSLSIVKIYLHFIRNINSKINGTPEDVYLPISLYFSRSEFISLWQSEDFLTPLGVTFIFLAMVHCYLSTSEILQWNSLAIAVPNSDCSCKNSHEIERMYRYVYDKSTYVLELKEKKDPGSVNFCIGCRLLWNQTTIINSDI